MKVKDRQVALVRAMGNFYHIMDALGLWVEIVKPVI